MVLATGAWGDRLANLDRPGAGRTAADRALVRRRRPADFAPDRFPVYLWDVPVPAGEPEAQIYGFPCLPGENRVKAAMYHDGSPATADPDALDRTVTEADYGRLGSCWPTACRAWPVQFRCARRPACTRVPATTTSCSALHPGSSGRVVLAVGFAGHGFKFTPVVGEIVADLVIDGSTRHEIGFLSPTRFGG